MRKKYLPLHTFECCTILRGTFGKADIQLRGERQQAAVIMWRKNDNKKQIYVSLLATVDFTSFDPSAWSMLVFWNE